MKKISTLLIVVLIISLVFSGCSGSDKKTDEIVESVTEKDTVTQEKVKTEGEDKNIPINTQIDNNMEIPEAFPKDIIPLLDDAKIDNIIKNDANKAININYNTGKSLKEASTFYREVMKDGRNTQEINSEDSNIIIGVKDNYVVSITIMALQGNTIVNIDTRPES